MSDELNKGLDTLTDYYFESRYPDMLDINLDNEDVAKDALKFAEEIVESIKFQLE